MSAGAVEVVFVCFDGDVPAEEVRMKSTLTVVFLRETFLSVSSSSSILKAESLGMMSQGAIEDSSLVISSN